MTKNKQDVIDMADAIYESLCQELDDMGILSCVNDELLSEKAVEFAEDKIEGLKEDYADYKREIEKERIM